ncbi:ABC transporter permease [Ornithinibacillus halophilus]|uniref:Osmoprotectant transport system permease protein n=1 Tax=Ornithinibacillus halophilus TaxID=930117 RepID=A0A1M5MWG9_9BACI|nr:ABC transporter permease [Ornithinibacillus halophilus]SHG81680.1 osmoprotectant transport system permease protein [Ornithinibacillus halophilus]
MQDYGYLSVFYERMPDLLGKLSEHIFLSGISVLLGCLVAIPLGVLLIKTHIRWMKSLTFNITNIFQTIPSIALLAMIATVLGFGTETAVMALFLYSLMPILKNTYAGFDSIDPQIIQSAEGMGYSPMQRLVQIEIPLALPYIMSGIRLTTVYIVSWAVLAGLIGGGGLGELILAALSLNDKPLIIASSVMAMILALVADFILGKLEKAFTKSSNTEAQKI